MENESHELQDAGVIAAIIDTLEAQQLPRALDLLSKVEAGGVLDDMDIGFLERVFLDTEELKPMLARHPEHQDLVARAIDLYHAITTRALANEREQKPEP